MNIQRALFGKRKLDKKQQRMFRALEFLLRLLVLSIPLYIVLGLSLTQPLLLPIQETVAGESAWSLELLGFQTERDGAFIISSHVDGGTPFMFMINDDCTGWKSMLFLFALVFAVPALGIRKRLVGLIVGIPLIWIVNIARVVGVVLVEHHYNVKVALLVHDYLWQFGLIATVLAIWFIWLMWVHKKKKKKGRLGRFLEVLRLPA